jgi:serine/threonine protein kinase
VQDEPDGTARYKICDFGLAKGLDGTTIDQNQIDTAEAGTKCFKAPEADVGNPTMDSDIYSFGIMLYTLISGTPPGPRLMRLPPTTWFAEKGFKGMEDKDPVKEFILALTRPLGDTRGWESNKALHKKRRPTASRALELFEELILDLQRRL